MARVTVKHEKEFTLVLSEGETQLIKDVLGSFSPVALQKHLNSCLTTAQLSEFQDNIYDVLNEELE